MFRVPRLVYVTNRRTAKHPLPDVAAKAVAGGVDLVQIREKDLNDVELRAVAVSILNRLGDPACISINCAPRIATELGIGLHLPEHIAQLTPGVRPNSRSVHSVESARNSKSVDFIVAGHVFPTASKPGLTPIGLHGFREIVDASSVPVIAIGGISPEHVQGVVAAGASGVAVISGINQAADPESAARSYRSALENAMERTAESITVTLNGKQTDIPSELTVQELLELRGHHDRLVVVELNGTIIRRPDFQRSRIENGAVIEIVHFVGGGMELFVNRQKT